MRARRLQADWGFTDLEMRDMVNAGALDLVEETVAAGAAPQAARKWWLGELARRGQRGRRRARRRCRSPRPRSPRIQALVDDGRAQRQAGPPGPRRRARRRGRPRTRSSRARGLAVVSDDGALGAAVDSAIAANPDVAEKIRDGKVAAAGALVGAVMKATRGQADAGRVRELILERLS